MKTRIVVKTYHNGVKTYYPQFEEQDWDLEKDWLDIVVGGTDSLEAAKRYIDNWLSQQVKTTSVITYPKNKIV